ncbi:MAG: extracellular solute-binding protein [Lachnospiraceae bacterium]|nr:extracellular solute-binding protein [Lachnospiraceae bacterium]
MKEEKIKGGKTMKARKILAAILVSGMLVSTMAACGGKATSDNGIASSETANSGTAAAEVTNSGAPADPFGKYNETVTIHLARSLDPNAKFESGQSIEENDLLKEIKNQLNIEVKYDWICAPADFDQKIKLAISANNLPDAVAVGMTPFKAMAKYGQIADLTDTFNNYGSDILKSFYKSGGDVLKKLVETDGKIMAIPATTPKASGMTEMWIRQDWLNKLNLQAPKSVEELKNVAKAFMEQDPDGDGKKNTIGIVGPSKSGGLTSTDGNLWGLDPVFAANKSFPGYWLKDKDGKVVYGSTQPETKKALQALAEMYKDGLIDREMLVRDDSLQPVLDNKAGIFFGPWWTGYVLNDAYKQNPAPDWQAYAYPIADDGKYYAHMSAPAGAFVVVNKKYEHPEAALKIVNLLLPNESKWVETGLGKNPGVPAVYPLWCVFDNVDEIEVSYDVLTKYLKGETDIKDIDFTTHKLLKGDMEAIKKLKKEPLDDFSINNWDLKSELASSHLARLISIMVGNKPLSTANNIEEVYSLYYGQTTTMESKGANLQKLENEAFAKIIMGRASIDSFDDFVIKWNKQGGENILKEIAEIAK